MVNQNQLILEEIKATGGNLSKVARSLGIDYFALKQRYPTSPPTGIFRPAIGPEPVDIRALGKPGLEQFVIAVKPAGSGWPSKYDDVIADARKRYDAGTHEMFQAPKNGWVVQYLMPRLRPAASRDYFSTMGAVV